MKKSIKAFAVIYFLASLPLVVLVVWNASFRYDFFNAASHYQAKIASPDVVLIGDSITAGGGVWGSRLSWHPLNAITLAQSGYTIRQVRLIAPTAIRYSPDFIFVMAGTNDVSDPRYSLEASLSDYREMLESICKSDIQCVVTLVPHQSQPDNRLRIDELNSRIRSLAESLGCTVVNLNTFIAPDGLLFDQYTSDGVHFTEAAYGVWSEMLIDAVRHSGGSR